MYMRIVKQPSELGRKRRQAFSLFAWMAIAPLQAAEQTLEVESLRVEDGFARVLEPRTSAEPGPPPSLTELETRARAAGSGLWGTYPEQAEAWRRGAAR